MTTNQKNLSAELTDVETHEVSIVTRGANGKIIALTKTMEDALAVESQLEENLLDQFSGSEEDEQALRIVLRALASLDDQEITKRAIAALTNTEGGGEMPEDTTEALPERDFEQELESLRKSMEEEKSERIALQKKFEEAEAQKIELEKALQEENEKAEIKEAIAKAESLPHMPGEMEENADLLRAIKTLGPDIETLILSKLDAMNKVIEKSTLIEEKGINVDGEKSASDEINTHVKELLKSDASLTHAQAYVQVVRNRPDLKERLRKGE